jgi:peptidoglycan/xylan/chitin deacetylase (PgdA/CDA1 family)
VALTFDCCGGPGGSGFDHTLLSALVSHEVPATFFLNARWVRSNPVLTKEIVANPLFEVANHGAAHLPLSVTGRQAYGLPGTKDAGMVYDEIMGAQAELSAFMGGAPRFFRSGTAHYDDVAAQICRALGLVPVNFNVNADGGATYPAATVTAEILSARPGSIIIAHANQPRSGTGAGVAAALPQMLGRGTRFIRLCDAPPL